MAATGSATAAASAPLVLSARTVFSADGEHFLVCERLYVRVFSTSTALPTGLLGPHPAAVSGVAVGSSAVAGSPHHVWSACLDGILRLWNILDGDIVCTLNVNRPVTALVALELPTEGDDSAEGEGASSKSSAPAVAATTPARVCVLAVACAKASVSLPPPPDAYSDCFGSILLIVPKIPRTRGEAAKATSKAHIGTTKSPARLLVTAEGGFLLFVENTRVRIFRTHLSRSEQKRRLLINGKEELRLRHTRALTVCAAIAHNGAPIGNRDPGEAEKIHWPYGYVAAGDISGRLLVWNLRLIMEKDRRVGKATATASSKVHVLSSNEATTNHWHAKAITSLCFGAYDTHELFSTGFEAVLVRWKLSQGSGPFLPRLGLPPLSSLARSPADPTSLLLLCGDAALRLVNTGTMAVRHSIQGLKSSPISTISLRSRVDRVYQVLNQANTYAFDSKRGVLIAPTAAGTVQFFDAIKGRHVLEVSVPASPGASAYDTQPLDLIPSGEESGVSSFDDTASYVHARNVHIVAYSSQGFLATAAADGSAIHIFQDTTRTSGVPYRLACEILYPHSQPLSFLAFMDKSETLVSSSLDGAAKLWVRHKKGWVCKSICYYRNEPITSAALSEDESVLVLGHTAGAGRNDPSTTAGESLLGNCVSVWSVADNALVTVIPLDMPRGIVYQVLVIGSCVVVVCKAGDGKVVGGGGGGSGGNSAVRTTAAATAEHVIATYDIFSRRLLWARCLPNSVALNGSCVAVGRHSLLLPLCADKFIEQRTPSGEDGDVVYAREPFNIAVELTVDGSVARAWQLPRTFSLVEAVVPVESKSAHNEDGMTAQYIVILEGRDVAVLWDSSKVSDSDELAQLGQTTAQDLDENDEDNTMNGLRPLSVSVPSKTNTSEQLGQASGEDAVMGLVQSLRLTPSHLLPQPTSLLDDFLMHAS